MNDTLFVNNEAKILAIITRTFNAKDKNGNEYIDGNEEHGDEQILAGRDQSGGSEKGVVCGGL